MTEVTCLCAVILEVRDNGLTLFPSMGILLFALMKLDLGEIPSSNANLCIFWRSVVTLPSGSVSPTFWVEEAYKSVEFLVDT